tara:strand:- start:210 stop:389 length:180 start_codon:yes stop_codon:yes gene_type:complete
MAYTEMKLKELLKDLRVSNIPDSEAFDIADGIVFEEEGLKEYLESKGITDPVGYIADRL